MTIEMIIIWMLVGILLVQQVFYSWQIHKMLNKVMSKNYAEWAQVEGMIKPQETGFRVKLDEIDPEQDPVRQLNKMIGM